MQHFARSNRHVFFWLRVGIIAFALFVFFIFGGKSLVARGFSSVMRFILPERKVSLPYYVSALEAKIKDLELNQARLQSVIGQAGSQKRFLADAKVIFGGGYLFSDTITIDRGIESGIAKGDFVGTEDGILFGVIADTGTWWSRVAPFTQLGKKTMVRGGALKDIVFEVNGVGGGEMQAELPVSINLKVGDVIWSGDFVDRIVGMVERLDQSPASQVQNMIMRQPRALQSLIQVQVFKQNI